jgi:hypothetical protein
MSMKIFSVLRYYIQPELNHLYTVRPFINNEGMDCGWYCREHALHCYHLSKMFGIDADLRRGDFAVNLPGQPMVTSIDSDSDHAWCSIQKKIPVDISITFKYFGAGPRLKGPIIGTQRNGPYDIIYTKNEREIKDRIKFLPHKHWVSYVEKSVIRIDDEDLVANPFLFLHPPIAGDDLAWVQLYGCDIYSKISLHLREIAMGNISPTYNKFSDKETLEYIISNYSEADEQLLYLISKNSGAKMLN